VVQQVSPVSEPLVAEPADRPVFAVDQQHRLAVGVALDVARPRQPLTVFELREDEDGQAKVLGEDRRVRSVHPVPAEPPRQGDRSTLFEPDARRQRQRLAGDLRDLGAERCVLPGLCEVPGLDAGAALDQPFDPPALAISPLPSVEDVDAPLLRHARLADEAEEVVLLVGFHDSAAAARPPRRM